MGFGKSLGLRLLCLVTFRDFSSDRNRDDIGNDYMISDINFEVVFYFSKQLRCSDSSEKVAKGSAQDV